MVELTPQEATAFARLMDGDYADDAEMMIIASRLPVEALEQLHDHVTAQLEAAVRRLAAARERLDMAEGEWQDAMGRKTISGSSLNHAVDAHHRTKGAIYGDR